jgi:hypothetical protein
MIKNQSASQIRLQLSNIFQNVFGNRCDEANSIIIDYSLGPLLPPSVISTMQQWSLPTIAVDRFITGYPSPYSAMPYTLRFHQRKPLTSGIYVERDTRKSLTLEWPLIRPQSVTIMGAETRDTQISRSQRVIVFSFQSIICQHDH